ncbi:hypothetical protein LPJ59_002038 [Coemansia sp. RSA 2399]|nr:hypothetical protein LPJ59_002038 [Coemansia sp. RSA 2399]KAJ1907600.1 hypothetical protein LPJ81_000651 [Coemansia sp. IMI 209127]
MANGAPLQSNKTEAIAPINGMKSGEGPIWFTRMPNVEDEDTHSNSYLYCRMAHSGHSRWTESSTETSGGQRRCCFCLADTQRIGCIHGTCPKNQSSSLSVAPPNNTHTAQLEVGFASEKRTGIKPAGARF